MEWNEFNAIINVRFTLMMVMILTIIQPLNLIVCDRYSKHLLNNHNHELGLVRINRQYHPNQLLQVFHDIRNDQIHMRSPSLFPICMEIQIDKKINFIHFYSFIFGIRM